MTKQPDVLGHSPTYDPPTEHPMVGHDDGKKANNGLEVPLYSEPVPHKPIKYTKKDFDDIASKVPPRLDSDIDEAPENRKGVKVIAKEDKEQKSDIKEIKGTLKEFKKGQEVREHRRDHEKPGYKDEYWDSYKKKRYE